MKTLREEITEAIVMGLQAKTRVSEGDKKTEIYVEGRKEPITATYLFQRSTICR